MSAKPPRSKITQQDVARLAGVSVSAVSLALGGKSRISPESVSLIYQAIETLGYQYPPASSQISPLPELVGLILPYHCPFSHPLLPALCQSLQATGKSVLLRYSELTESALLAASGQLIKQGCPGSGALRAIWAYR